MVAMADSACVRTGERPYMRAVAMVAARRRMTRLSYASASNERLLLQGSRVLRQRRSATDATEDARALHDPSPSAAVPGHPPQLVRSRLHTCLSFVFCLLYSTSEPLVSNSTDSA